MTETEVVVVGGGATGVGVARDLALRGIDVVLCERDGLSAGTTGHSHGVLHSGARYAGVDPTGARECWQENQVLRSIGGACVAATGGLFVQLADDAVHLEDRLAACRELDIPVERLDAAAARAAEPALTAAVTGAFRVPDGVVYPSRLVAATAESAVRHGATIRPASPVTDVLVDDTVVGVVAGGETITADHVVNAAGPWAGRVASLAGLDVAMAPTAGVMVAFAGPTVETVLNRCRPPADGDIAVPQPDGVIVGTTSTPTDDPDAIPRDDAAVDRMRAAGAALVPAVAEAPIDRVYWGVRPLYAESAGRGRDAPRGFRVIDHAARDGLEGLTTVVGGKLTTHRLMAEAVADGVCRRLGIDAACRTASEPLPARDPAGVDRLVDRYGIAVPADAPVVTDG